MMGFVEEDSQLPSPKVIDCLERLWVLYLDHEMTNSTTAFLHVASTLADPISCCTAYVASGNGPLHAGAVDLAYKNLQRLGTPDGVPTLIADVKAKKYRLFGYGHRIYKTVDPRTKFIRAMLDELSERENDNPLLAVALEIDRTASKDEYFTSRNLKANADLYGCFVYTALYVGIGSHHPCHLGDPADYIMKRIRARYHRSSHDAIENAWNNGSLERSYEYADTVPVDSNITNSIFLSLGQPPRLWRPQQVFAA